VPASGAAGSALAYFEGHGVGEGFAGVVVRYGVAVEVDEAVQLGERQLPVGAEDGQAGGA